MIAVTALYDINGGSLGFEKYFELLKELLELITIPIIVFCDEIHVDTIKSLGKAIVIPKALESFEIYQLLMSQQLELPKHRHETKDTQIYMTLMNMKIEFLSKARETLVAREIQQSEHYMWIDAGITKIFSGNIKEKFEELAYFTPPPLLLPAIWPKNSYALDYVCWRFAGGVMFCSKEVIDDFYEKIFTKLEHLVNNGQLTWEVNVWYMIEHEFPEFITTYPSDHNNSIMDFILAKQG